MFSSQTLFKLTALATTIFVITILAMVAMLVGDPDAPINVWFNHHGATVMTVEVVAIGALGMSAMLADRNETLRAQKKNNLKTGNPHNVATPTHTVAADFPSEND